MSAHFAHQDQCSPTIEEVSTLPLASQPDGSSRAGPESIPCDTDVDQRVAVQLVQQTSHDSKYRSELGKEHERSGQDIGSGRRDALELCSCATGHADNGDDERS